MLGGRPRTAEAYNQYVEHGRGSPTPQMRPYPRSQLDVEAEVHDVTFLDDVFLPFQSPLPRFLGAHFALVGDEILVGDHFGADEALLEVGMDHSRRLGRSRTFAHRPGPHFLLAGGEVGLQTQQLVAGTD